MPCRVLYVCACFLTFLKPYTCSLDFSEVGLVSLVFSKNCFLFLSVRPGFFFKVHGGLFSLVSFVALPLQLVELTASGYQPA